MIYYFPRGCFVLHLEWCANYLSVYNKMKNLFVAVLFVALCGCATRPISNSEAKPVPLNRVLNTSYSTSSVNTTKVTVKRDSGISGSGCSTKIFLNAAPIAELDCGEKIELHLLAGEYILSAWPNGVCGGGMSESKLTLVQDKEQSYRVGYGSNGDFYLNPTAF
jgi:hypothetical protein